MRGGEERRRGGEEERRRRRRQRVCERVCPPLPPLPPPVLVLCRFYSLKYRFVPGGTNSLYRSRQELVQRAEALPEASAVSRSVRWQSFHSEQKRLDALPASRGVSFAWAEASCGRKFELELVYRYGLVFQILVGIERYFKPWLESRFTKSVRTGIYKCVLVSTDT